MAAGMLFSDLAPLLSVCSLLRNLLFPIVTALHYIFGFIVSRRYPSLYRCSGRVGKGSQSLLVSRTLSDHYCSGSISLKPYLWCKGRVDGFAVARFIGRLRVCGVSQGGVGDVITECKYKKERHAPLFLEGVLWGSDYPSVQCIYSVSSLTSFFVRTASGYRLRISP